MSFPSLAKYVEELRSQPVESLLSDLVQTSADSNLAKIVGLLRERGVYEVFLPEDTRCGMISARDVLKTANIVGLPTDPFEAEATKAKLKRIVNQLHRVFPDILEARSVIKSKFSKLGKERGRYEVTVQIRTTKDTYSCSEEGWELPAVYDIITDRLKRLMTRKQKPHGQRLRESPETF